MSLLNRNNRSIHSDAKRIKANLNRHAELMAKYVAGGMSREDASRQAMRDMNDHVADSLLLRY